MRYKIFDIFADRPFEGNPTGVVYWESLIDKARMQNIASELSVPDTVFVLRSSDPKILFFLLAFSPYEELSICGQGIIGAMFSFIEENKVSVGKYKIETPIGSLDIFVEEEKDNIVVFTSLGRATISEVDENASSRVLQMLDKEQWAPFRKAFVALGRKRLVIQVSPEVLREVRLESMGVVSLCRDLGITGIVFFAKDTENLACFRSRHFTTSLNGREDAVTGGASGAILAFCNHMRIKDGRALISIHQGDFATRGGRIYAKSGRTAKEILVGGHGVLIAQGQLYL